MIKGYKNLDNSGLIYQGNLEECQGGLYTLTTANRDGRGVCCNLGRSAALISEEYIDGGRPWSRQTQSMSQRCKPQKCCSKRGGSVEAENKTVKLHQRTAKHSSAQIACIKEAKAGTETRNSTASRLVPGALVGKRNLVDNRVRF